jgi:short-subunit dehydrogenase
MKIKNAVALVAGDVTLLINNAGDTAMQGAVSASGIEAARQEMGVNDFGPLQMSRAFAPILGENGGAIANVLSFLSLVTPALMVTNSASNAAALSPSHSLRAELKADSITVLAAMPVQIDPAMGAWTPEDKVSPSEAAADIVDAIASGVDAAFPGALPRGAAQAFQNDPKGLQAHLASVLPSQTA